MNNEQATLTKGFNFSWQNVDPEVIGIENDFFEMRNWQTRAFEQLKSEPYMILNAPMGSGKSLMMCFLSVHKMKRDSSLRCIIAVPQTIIAFGFLNEKLHMSDGEKVNWKIKYNFCGKQASKVNALIHWLENPSTIFLDRIAVCSHATLVMVYKRLKNANRLNVLKNFLLWIDEAHHIKNTALADFDDIVISNGIGELVLHCLNAQSSNIQMGLTTASFFRGDRTSLLTETMELKFKRFNLPYDEYLKSMRYLKSFSFDFLSSGHNYVKAIKTLIQLRRGKDIIYIPHPVSQYSTGDKHKEVNDIISAYGKISHSTQDGLLIVTSKAEKQKILDLVDKSNREQKKAFLNTPTLKKDRTVLDVIIALGMFKEGANWTYADRSIIVGARSSLVDIIQMVGRLFRDVEGKEHVEIIQLLPFSLDQQDKEVFSNNLNNYLKAIFASLILENILNPVQIKSIKKVANNRQKDDCENNKKNWLQIALPDDAKQQKLMEEISNALVEISDTKKETISNTTLLYDAYVKVASVALENYGITENKEEISKQIWGTLVRRSMQMQGVSVENIDFNIIQEIHPLDFLIRYTSGACSINTFEKLREAIQLSRAWLSFENARNFVRNLNLKNQREWHKFTKSPNKPKNIPAYPNEAYANEGWINLGDWLGTGTIASQHVTYRTFEEARTFVQAICLQNNKEWRSWSKTDAKPKDVPAAPDRIYANTGWTSWGDFLGTNTVFKKTFKPFEEAKVFTRNLKFKSRNEWHNWAKSDDRPQDIPSNPGKNYARNGWLGWGDFLGTGTIAHFEKKFKSFKAARSFARKLSLKGKDAWFSWTKSGHRPADIPSAPNRTYAARGWIGWKDWLGTDR